MSTFETLCLARDAGYEICRVDADGIVVRRATSDGNLFGWVPLPARFVFGTDKLAAFEQHVEVVPPPRASCPSSPKRSAVTTLWFPPL